jgi:hypothetical protein
MKITVIPYKAPRKHRKQENHGTIVQWLEGDVVKFQKFHRDNAALAFVEHLTEDGIPPEFIKTKQY